MSTVKTNRNQIGISATPTQNFTLTAEAADGSMKLARGNAGATTQDILTVDNAGYLYANVVPPQFNNTGALATTSFVQQAMGNMAGYVAYSTTTTLTTADVGKFVYASGATMTLTLPSALTVPAGSRLYIQSSSGTTLTVTNPNGNFAGPNGIFGTGSPNIVWPAAVGGEFISNGASWIAISGSGVALLSSTGYQKLPSGLIIQWGSVTATTGNGGGGGVGVTATYPIAFPNAYRVVLVTPSQTTSVGTSAWTDAEGNSGVRITTNGVSGTTVRYIAIGN